VETTEKIIDEKDSIIRKQREENEELIKQYTISLNNLKGLEQIIELKNNKIYELEHSSKSDINQNKHNMEKLNIITNDMSKKDLLLVDKTHTINAINDELYNVINENKDLIEKIKLIKGIIKLIH